MIGLMLTSLHVNLLQFQFNVSCFWCSKFNVKKLFFPDKLVCLAFHIVCYPVSSPVYFLWYSHVWLFRWNYKWWFTSWWLLLTKICRSVHENQLLSELCLRISESRNRKGTNRKSRSWCCWTRSWSKTFKWDEDSWSKRIGFGCCDHSLGCSSVHIFLCFCYVFMHCCRLAGEEVNKCPSTVQCYHTSFTSKPSAFTLG